MAYEIRYKRAASKALDDLPAKTTVRVLRAIAKLADDPFPPGSEKLQGSDDEHRIRVGDYRVIYTVERDIVTVFVVRIGHRREVYRH